MNEVLGNINLDYWEEVKCQFCGKKGYRTEFGDLCKNHFLRIIYKKIRSNMRKYQFFKPYSYVYIENLDLEDPKALFLKELLLDLQKVFPFELVDKKEEANVIAEPLCLEDIVLFLFKGFMFNEEFLKEIWIKKDNLVRPIFNIPLREITLFLKLRNINYCKDFLKKFYEKVDLDLLSYIFSVCSEKRTQRFSLLNSALFFGEIVNGSIIL